MKLPDYFQDIPALVTRDPLADALGCAEGGILEYSYADAVRFAGHSCPTVAAAYWCTYLALEHLFGEELPVRGTVRVEFRDAAGSGSTGVASQVVQLLTGAAGRPGFKGLAGRYCRAGLMRYTPDLPAPMRFTRMHTTEFVDVEADLSMVPGDSRLPGLVSKHADGTATRDEELLLGQLWQERVRQILVDHARDPAVFMVRPRQARPSADFRPTLRLINT